MKMLVKLHVNCYRACLFLHEQQTWGLVRLLIRAKPLPLGFIKIVLAVSGGDSSTWILESAH